MKKRSIILFGVGLCVLAVLVLSRTPMTSAQAAPTITIDSLFVHENTVHIRWNTDTTTTSSLSYGTAAGNLGTTVDSATSSGTSHSAYIQDLADSTMYYYQITATNLDNVSTTTDMDSFTTEIGTAGFDSIVVNGVGPNHAVVYGIGTVRFSRQKLDYGTSSDALTESAASHCSFRCDGAGQTWWHHMDSLQPNTTYYYQLSVTKSSWIEDPVTVSDVYSLTTTSTPSISGINPTSGPTGTTVTFSGSGFGDGPSTYPNTEYRVGFGCDVSVSEPACLGDIVSWTDTEIVARVTSNAVSGTVALRKETTYINIDLATISGPRFTVTGDADEGDDADDDDDTVTTPTTPTVTPDYLTSTYGCTLSTTTADDNTIKVRTLFTDGSETDNYLESVSNAYQSAWGRVPYCGELQFHYDHSTPIDRLISWLNDETISEKYGCSYSTTVSDDNTVRVPTLFTLDSDRDKYIGDVVDAYKDAWGRDPYCTEIQFHVDHSTAITRLQSWLSETEPSAETAEEAAETEEDTSTALEFTDDGTALDTSDDTSLSFTDAEQITFRGVTVPNALVVLTVASDPQVYTTKSDADGNWTYTLAGPLETGNHTVKTVVYDENNEIIRESDTIAFTVTQATGGSGLASSQEVDEPSYVVLIVIVIAAALLVILIAIVSRKPKTE